MTRINIEMDYLSLSHNLRIPLTEILGLADLLSTTDLSSTQKDEVEMIRNAGNKLLDLVNKILASRFKDETQTISSH